MARLFEKILTAVYFHNNSGSFFEYALKVASRFDAELAIMEVINEPVGLRSF